MLLTIAIPGGCLVMMGQHTRSESLFCYFRLENQVPENHLLRLIVVCTQFRLLIAETFSTPTAHLTSNPKAAG
jgi:hypothetical protein